MSQGADKLRESLVKAAESSGKKVLVRRTGCMGPCSSGPLVRVDPEDTLYHHVNAGHAEAIVSQPGRKTGAGLAVRSERALRQAGAGGTGECRPHRSGKNRRLHCPRRLQGAPDGADGDDAQRRDSPHHRERPSRTRRRRLSHRAEMGNGCQGRGRREVRGLQRRRGRPRRVHGSQRDGRRPASRHRGHGHCGLRRGREQGLHLCPGRVSGGCLSADHGHPRGAAAGFAGQRHLQYSLQLRCGDPSGRGRVCLRRGDGADWPRSRAGAERRSRGLPIRR
jgi:(2Fe-2S) ferredoxin